MEKGTRRAKQLVDIYSIGLKLHTLRVQKGLTLSRLAAETSLSTALLSKLETGHMIPTLTTLATICRVYGVGLGFFFAETKKHSMSITRSLVATRRGRTQETMKEFPLNAKADFPILAREVDFPPKHTETMAEVGKVFTGVIYVLEGSLQLESAGQKDVMEAGDCVCLNSDMLIFWGASGTTRCRALVVTQG
ncbi:helix-turn-helix domain-containing protein [Telmatobacter sp. DSM 110680]|uniref:Helix-turn-helix domain-containing protein n=1 Tax=Telmatobacter sp. DSM 110680 TaxID=3036704 RepID=A0AAU7DK13_9BACT